MGLEKRTAHSLDLRLYRSCFACSVHYVSLHFTDYEAKNRE